MPRDKSIKVWVDGITAARLAVQAEAAGTSVSEYVGDLIARDRAEAGHADALAGELLEMNYLTAILLRTLLVRSMGETEADKLLARARTKAHEQAQAVLTEIREQKLGR